MGVASPRCNRTCLHICCAALLLRCCSGCSFIVTNFDPIRNPVRAPFGSVNYYNQKRGPDATNIFQSQQRRNWWFVHNLLSMTGAVTKQPFVSADGNVVALFNVRQRPVKCLRTCCERAHEHAPSPPAPRSPVLAPQGEIYNWRSLAKELGGSEQAYQSDGFAILPAYARWGRRFVQHLEGEFAIVLVDFREQIVLLSTDVFSTKPCATPYAARCGRRP